MSSEKLRYDGRVVLVTGAGGGLGKEYALAFASRGAKVVVNDLGGDRKGDGQSSRPADLVVDEIRANGGTAVANYDSVEDGDKLVKTALDNFGRIDVIIHNAGILRDRSFARISDIDWDIIHRIHVRSVFLISRAAWPHMKNQNYGRIIVVSSSAGLYGNFGQANYSAAKMAVVGLMNTLAVEGRKNNILVNAVAPVAASRLTEDIFPESLFKLLKPELVAPLMLWLCHEQCEETGGVFECGGGWTAKLQLYRTPGAILETENNQLTPEAVRDHWKEVCDFSKPTHHATIQEANMGYLSALQAKLGSQGVKPNKTRATDSSAMVKAIGTRGSGVVHTYTERDVILYALGVGVSTAQEDHLKFLFEGHPDFCCLPTFVVIPAFTASTTIALSVDPTMILHGEQYTELLEPLAGADQLTSTAVLTDVLDKGSGAVIVYDTETVNGQGRKIAFNQSVVFIQRAGGFGGRRTSEKIIPIATPPNRAPCASIRETTGIDQAALYRLSGDRNPLHIDPQFAALGGFSTPILHGLSSYGYAVRHVLKQFCNNDVTKFKAVKVRFSNPVLPGQTIQTDMWKEGSRVFFQCKVVETGKLSLTGAYVDLFETKASTTAATSSTAQSSPSLKSEMLFEAIGGIIENDQELPTTINAVYGFVITKNGSPAAEWTVDLRKGHKGSVARNKPGQIKADCTITLSDEDFFDLASGVANGQKLFFEGRLKVSGNIMLVMRLEKVFSANRAKL